MTNFSPIGGIPLVLGGNVFGWTSKGDEAYAVLGKFRLVPGDGADDTSMALCLADSLLSCGGVDPSDQMARYRR